MNKPLLIVLLVILVLLLVYMFAFREEVDTRPALPPEQPPAAPVLVAIDGIETEETPEFNVEVATKEVGTRKELEFVITEAHGWAVDKVWIRARYGKVNPETGEFESDMQYPVEMLSREGDIIDFGKPLVAKTTLTSVELTQTKGELGGPENWEATVYKWASVFKPKD